MSDEEMRDESESDTSSHEASDSEPIELLVAGRERRKTAGNRYDRSMVQEEAEEEVDADEVALLFAEGQDEEDEEFQSEASGDDEMSSSDDEDQGPNAGVDNLEGEQELQKQAKEERAKKRKAELALTSTAGLRKRPKIDPTQPKPAVKKPSKKKERVTWLPDQDAAAARSSLRKQTVAHREITLARLKESEAQSKKLKALKEQRDRERAKDAPKEMTQADRLAEAERTERRNAKSLNRWEAMEKRRTEEQAAKLAALKERKLKGPVITLLSAKGRYIGWRPVLIESKPFNLNDGEPKKRGRKTKAYHEHMAALRAAGESSPSTPQTPHSATVLPPMLPNKEIALPSRQPQPSQPSQPLARSGQPQTPGLSFLSGIHEYASMQNEEVTAMSSPAATQPGPSTAASTGHSSPMVKESPLGAVESRLQSQDGPNRSHPRSQDGPDEPSHATETTSEPANHATGGQSNDQLHVQQVPTSDIQPALLPAPAPPEPKTEVWSTKNLVILDKLDELSDTARQKYSFFFNSRRTAKQSRHNPEICPITLLPARYRDPKTGIGYANLYAYKVLQELSNHRFRWSSMLGCYIGREGGVVARNVPEGFMVSAP